MELMIVMAIIGVLAAALATQVTGIREYARAAKCKSHLKSLMVAAQNYGSQGHYPAAGSFEWTPSNRGHTPKDSNGKPSGATLPIYYGEKSWVAWTYQGSATWPWRSGQNDYSINQSYGKQMERATFFGERAFISITNGTLWELVGKDISVYVCEAHKTEAQKVLSPTSEKVYRSYVMSNFFIWDDPGARRDKNGAKITGDGAELRTTDDTIMDGRAGIRLLFAELPARDIRKNDKKYTDSVLENDEPIGFNHFLGKKWVAHAVFLDGHVAGLILPNSAKDGSAGFPNYSHNDLKELTKHLCEATEISNDIRERMR